MATEKQEKIEIKETQDVNEANRLVSTGKYRSPIFSERRGFILIPRRV